MRSESLGKRLYIGNLAETVTHADLREWFARYGTVQSAIVVQDTASGRSKGFAFVEMGTDGEAQAAIEGLNEQIQAGRSLRVDEARPRLARTARWGEGAR